MARDWRATGARTLEKLPHTFRDRHAITEADLEAAFKASPLFKQLEALGAEGPDPIPDSDAKCHHFIPQFLLLLRQFLVLGQERLCQLDTASGKPQAIAPASAASRRHFYSVTDEEEIGTTRSRASSG
jgi:hypothetical protein